MEQDRYEKMLFKLFLKGIIDEETLEEKMEESKKKKSEDIQEIKVEEYIAEAIKRICAERFKEQ